MHVHLYLRKVIYVCHVYVTYRACLYACGLGAQATGIEVDEEKLDTAGYMSYHMAEAIMGLGHDIYKEGSFMMSSSTIEDVSSSTAATIITK
jgi:hypothetical protein